MSRWIVAVLVGWVVALALGFVVIATWETTPGTPPGTTPAHWPVADGGLPRSAQHSTVMMFAHPGCSCTRAGLAELTTVMLDDRHDATAIVVFFAPSEADPAWLDTATWEAAGRVPRVQRVIDRDGALAKQFGATTSGHVVAYDRDGVLLFSGGITGSRGHVGDNLGSRGLLAHLTEGTGPAVYDVFGCGLGGS